MLKLVRLWLYTGWLTGILATTALGHPPVFSMEVAAVNSTPVPGSIARHLEVLPGDTLTLRIYLRNWSPAGEPLNAYQMQLEVLDFASGMSGTIKPVNYETARETNTMNLDNCFVDQLDPEWIFSGHQTITLVDTRSAGYRWMSVLVDTADAILCDQNDAKYYTGTVMMSVSDDARGTFTIGFMEEQTSSLLLDEHGVMITPLEFEVLTIVVQPDILGVIDRLNGTQNISVKRADIDGDGDVATNDVRRALDFLNGLSTDATPTEAGTEPGTEPKTEAGTE